ncbi:MAG: hypothetical protein AB8B61_04645 [Cyclobacteriaceae bacterium]
MNRKIREEVGDPFSLLQILKMRGVGSPRFMIQDASPRIAEVLSSESCNFCNIEIRKEGIIIWFNRFTTSYAYAIPFRSLTVFQTKKGVTIYDNTAYLLLKKSYKDNKSYHFLEKVIRLKSTYLDSQGLARVDDM